MFPPSPLRHYVTPPPNSNELWNLGEVAVGGWGWVLPPISNPRGMFLGQACLTNALLHFRNVIGNAAWFPRLGGAVVNRIRGPRITVARLAYGTGVSDQPWL